MSLTGHSRRLYHPRSVTTVLVSYATDLYAASQQRLVASASRHGIRRCVAWNRSLLKSTDFYRQHHGVLDLPRGGGYWQWKPYVIHQALDDVSQHDIVVYCDAGIEIVGDLTPLFALCRQHDGLLLFAGHYDKRGPNVCRRWTKRDCFVYLQCDEPQYHDGPMLDASCLVVAKTGQSMQFISEWLRWCCNPALITDQPNECGLANFAEFIEHRHDQSILSLLARGKGIELFRHPSQYGNHLKCACYRVPGEWTRHPYSDGAAYVNSRYGTLLNHHRGRLDGVPRP